MSRVYRDIEEIMRANKDAGQYFFSPSTLLFFHSEISPTVYGGKYFITSESFDGTPQKRKYTVRVVEDSGAISTVGEFNILSYGQAVRLAKKSAKE